MNLNNFKNHNYIQKIISTTAMFLFFSALLYFFVFVPTVNDIESLRASIISQKLDLEKKLAQNNNMVKLSEKLKIIEPELDALDSIFINKNRELEFITTLEGVASRYNLSQSLKLSFDKQEIIQGHKKIPVNLEVSGTLNDVAGYLRELEKLNYYINPVNLQLSARDNNEAVNSNPRVSLSFNANTYWQ